MRGLHYLYIAAKGMRGVQATVDNSKERFTHGRPDAELLRIFCREKFGWNTDKVDQILEPVLKVCSAPAASACGLCRNASG